MVFKISKNVSPLICIYDKTKVGKETCSFMHANRIHTNRYYVYIQYEGEDFNVRVWHANATPSKL